MFLILKEEAKDPITLVHFKVQTWGQQQSQKVEASLAALEAEKEEIQRLLDWISSAEEALCLRDQEPLAESTDQNKELIEQHTVMTLLFI